MNGIVAIQNKKKVRLLVQSIIIQLKMAISYSVTVKSWVIWILIPMTDLNFIKSGILFPYKKRVFHPPTSLYIDLRTSLNVQLKYSHWDVKWTEVSIYKVLSWNLKKNSLLVYPKNQLKQKSIAFLMTLTDLQFCFELRKSWHTLGTNLLPNRPYSIDVYYIQKMIVQATFYVLLFKLSKF